MVAIDTYLGRFKHDNIIEGAINSEMANTHWLPAEQPQKPRVIERERENSERESHGHPLYLHICSFNQTLDKLNKYSQTAQYLPFSFV